MARKGKGVWFRYRTFPAGLENIFNIDVFEHRRKVNFFFFFAVPYGQLVKNIWFIVMIKGPAVY